MRVPVRVRVCMCLCVCECACSASVGIYANYTPTETCLWAAVAPNLAVIISPFAFFRSFKIQQLPPLPLLLPERKSACVWERQSESYSQNYTYTRSFWMGISLVYFTSVAALKKTAPRKNSRPLCLANQSLSRVPPPRVSVCCFACMQQKQKNNTSNNNNTNNGNRGHRRRRQISATISVVSISHFVWRCHALHTISAPPLPAALVASHIFILIKLQAVCFLFLFFLTFTYIHFAVVFLFLCFIIVLKVLLELQMNMCCAMRIECGLEEELAREREREREWVWRGGKRRYIVARVCIECGQMIEWTCYAVNESTKRIETLCGERGALTKLSDCI